MQICGYEKFSMVDYDEKIACTVFTNGCNLRCPFCQNGPLVVDSSLNEPIDEQEVFDYLIKRKGLVDAVCVSGGEPTLQPDLVEFIKKVKELGYLVKLDTNGMRPEVIKDLLDKGLLDYIAMDIKNDPERYPETVGIKNINFDKIKESINLIMNSGIDYEFRTTMMSELHGEKEIEGIGELIKGAKKYYIQHYKDSENCIAHGFTDIPYDKIESYKKILEKYVDFVGVRGY